MDVVKAPLHEALVISALNRRIVSVGSFQRGFLETDDCFLRLLHDSTDGLVRIRAVHLGDELGVVCEVQLHISVVHILLVAEQADEVLENSHEVLRGRVLQHLVNIIDQFHRHLLNGGLIAGLK